MAQESNRIIVVGGGIGGLAASLALVRQGFDGDAARRRIDQLIARYEGGWAFQRKPHLRHDNDD